MRDRVWSVVAAAVVALAVVPLARGQAPSWVGARVVTKNSATLRIGGQVVDDGVTFRVYTVERANGDWLWLVAGGASGWVRARDVVPFDRAIDYFTQQIRINPGSASAYLNRGFIWHEKSELNIALADYDEAIRLDPKDPSPYNARAWLWATCPAEEYRDGPRAVAAATRACELTGWKDADNLDTLAAAHAEAGDFGKAVEYQEKANPLYTSEEDRTKGQARLALYKDGRPYREEPVP